MFDLIVRSATVVDPEKCTQRVADVAIENGRIALVEPVIAGPAREELPAEGLVLQPGVIDTHLHLTASLSSHAMAVRAGVTTAVDMAGPAGEVMAAAKVRGRGLNIAVLNAILPEHNVKDRNPDAAQIDAFLTASLSEGAFGVKLLGGHFPLTPEASARMVRQSAERGVYMAWHAGTTEKGSNLEGLREAVELCGGHSLHMAHLNAYCRGRVLPVLDECLEAAALLEAHPELVTESYLSARNGCPLGLNDDGTPKSGILAGNLRAFGFTPDLAGLRRAVLAHRLGILVPSEDDVAIVSGEAGLEHFERARAEKRPVDGSFDGVNPFASRAFFAERRRSDGSFLVDAIGTDGGGIPRNVILESGLSLVKLGALDAVDFAVKTSYLPSRMLGLAQKGTLAPGSDADLTIYDPVAQRAVHSLVKGRFLLRDGRAVGREARIVCTEAGVEAVRRAGLEPVVVSGGIPTLDRRRAAGIA